MAGYSVTFSVVDHATKELDAINRRIAAIRAPVERMSRTISRFVDVSGLRKVAQGFEWVGKAASSVLRTMVEIVPILGTITGAATLAGMANLVKSYASWSRELTSTADGIGMSTQKLQQFEDAMRLAGGQASDMDAALKGLYKNTTDFIRGQASTDTVGWLNRLGIEVRDSTGHLRSMTDLMPEVIDKISKIPVPADRAAASAALLGESGTKVIEGFRQSSKGFDLFFQDAAKYTELSDQQKKQLELFSEAQGRIGTAFDHLGQQISATLAKNFTPLINKLAEFVEKHQPEIIAAVDNISTKFAAWLEGIKWDDVLAGLQKVMDAFTWISTHLDEIKTVAEVIAGIFVTKWGIQIVAAIGQVVTAIGSTTAVAGVAGGVGLLGALGAVAGVAALGATAIENRKLNKTMEEQAEEQGFKKQGGSWWNPLDKIPTFKNEKTGETLSYGDMQKRLGYDPNVGMNPFAPNNGRGPAPGPGAQPGPPVDMGAQQENLRRAMDEQNVTDPSMRAGIAAIAAGEGGFKPRSEQGYGGTSNERIRGIFGARTSGMSDTELTALKGDDEKFFNKMYGGRLGNAENEGYKYRGRGDFQLTGKGNYERYSQMTGIDLVNNPDLVNDPAVSAKVSVAYMKDRYKGGGFEGMKRAVGNPVAETEAVKNRAYADYMRTGQFAGPAKAAAPTQVAGAAPQAPAAPTQAAANAPAVPAPASVNGAVDVSITHKNPPPDAAVTAKGSGQVNVAPPRVEYQDFAAI